MQESIEYCPSCPASGGLIRKLGTGSARLCGRCGYQFTLDLPSAATEDQDGAEAGPDGRRVIITRVTERHPGQRIEIDICNHSESLVPA